MFCIAAVKGRTMAKRTEEERLALLTTQERRFWERRLVVAGMDEVGRGPLAGPVMAACVILPPEPLIQGVNDSKKLSAAKREALAGEIEARALAVSVACVAHGDIDAINILQATKRAMAEAVAGLAIPADHVLVDAVQGLAIAVPYTPLVHGDAISYSIGAASIVAKVRRDAMMCVYEEMYPGYDFASNKGYGTKKHIAALKEKGPCPIHRRSFIKNFCW